VTAPVPVGDYTVTVSSAYGQVQETFVTRIDATNRVFTRTLDAPSNYGTITLLNQPSGWFGYRTASGGGTYSRVTPNSLGQGVVAVSLRTWELVRICSDGQLKSGTFTSLTTSSSNPHRTFNPGTVCS
jgi:hypothetical protein